VAVIRVACIPLLCLAMMSGCNAPTNAIGSSPLVPVTAEVAVGVWAMTDDRNDTFNAILRADGSATSTWSRGTDGARGEQGGWSVREGRLVMKWTDGWTDIIQLGRFGYEKLSYGPRDLERDFPECFGQAVKLMDDASRWVGVWRTDSVDTGSQGHHLFVCLSSDGKAMKSIDAINTGCWQLQADGVAIYWSDGWFTLLTRRGERAVGRSWMPGVDRGGAATGEAEWTEVRE
jgi:hypothetical protein